VRSSIISPENSKQQFKTPKHVQQPMRRDVNAQILFAVDDIDYYAEFLNLFYQHHNRYFKWPPESVRKTFYQSMYPTRPVPSMHHTSLKTFIKTG